MGYTQIFIESIVRDFAQRYDAMRDPVTGIARRADAGETMIVSKQLEHMMKEFFNIERPPLEMFTWLDRKNTAGPGATSITYIQREYFGQAKKIASYADDLPLVEGIGKSFTNSVEAYGAAFQISINDLQAAAMAGVPISAEKPAAARRVCDEAIDYLAAFGDPETTKTGFFNNASVPVITPITGTWSTATSDQIINDVMKLWNSIRVATKKVHNATHLLFDETSWGYLDRRTTETDMTIRKYLFANLPGIQVMDSTERLNLADAAGTGPRIVAYEKNRMASWIEVPVDFDMRPAQERNLSYITNCFCKSAGTIIPYPLTIAYMDGC